MKLHALAASAVALTLAFSTPALAVSKTDKEFAILVTASFSLAFVCPGYELVDGSAEKAADRNGADFDTVGPAIANAFKAQFDLPYQRTALIPEISVVVRQTLNEINDDLTRNQRQTCAKWGEILVPIGLIRRK